MSYELFGLFVTEITAITAEISENSSEMDIYFTKTWCTVYCSINLKYTSQSLIEGLLFGIQSPFSLFLAK